MITMQLEIIRIEKVQLYDFKRTHYGAGTCSMKLGDVLDFKNLIIFNSHIEKRIFLRSFPENVFINRQLQTFLNCAVLEFCNGERTEELFSFLDNEGGKFPDSALFTPGNWGGNPLLLYIKHIELRDIQCEHGREHPVTARIGLDDYMAFFRVPIYDPLKGEYIEPMFINNKNIIDAVNRMIRSAGTKKEIETVCEVGHHISSDYVCSEERTDIDV